MYDAQISESEMNRFNFLTLFNSFNFQSSNLKASKLISFNLHRLNRGLSVKMVLDLPSSCGVCQSAHENNNKSSHSHQQQQPPVKKWNEDFSVWCFQNVFKFVIKV